MRRKTFLGEQQSERTRHPSSSTAPSSNYFYSLTLFLSPTHLILSSVPYTHPFGSSPLPSLPSTSSLPTAAHVLTRFPLLTFDFCIPSDVILTCQHYLYDGRHRTFALLWNPIPAPTQRTPPSSRRDISFSHYHHHHHHRYCNRLASDSDLAILQTYPQLLQPYVICYLATQQIPICSKRYPDFDTMTQPTRDFQTEDSM